MKKSLNIEVNAGELFDAVTECFPIGAALGEPVMVEAGELLMRIKEAFEEAAHCQYVFDVEEAYGDYRVH